MESTHLIPIQQFCIHYEVELSFIDALSELGLIELITINQTRFLHHEQLRDIEKIIRMHYDLQINIEGIDAISHLLKRIDSLQEELLRIKNKLALTKNE